MSTPQAGAGSSAWPRNVPALRIVTTGVFAVGVVCQFVQDTDKTFPLLYYTVDSGILLLLSLVLTMAWPSWVCVDDVRGAATVGTVLSGLVFTAVIAPATETGTWIQPNDDYWIRTANVLLHGVGPVLAVADFLVSPQRSDAGLPTTALKWCVWPLTYFVVVLLLDIIGAAQIPYPFLDASTSGWAVAGSALVLGIAVFALGVGFAAANRLVVRPSDRVIAK